MHELVNVISKNAIFKGIDLEKLELSLKKINYTIRSYDKNETVVSEGDHCYAIGIILEGSIEIQNIYPSGKVATVTRMMPGQTFGEAILFSQESLYPISITTTKITKILFITKECLMILMSDNPRIMENYLSLLSTRLIMLNSKIKTLSIGTLRKKLANFILGEYKKQKKMTLKITISRKQMAEHLAVQRPSLSRELIALRDEQIITFDKSTITILDLEALEYELMD